ncbi:transposase [Bacteroides acidifaciens]|uniref:transposase n=1 Tax=Bacteroides acidifaciens TaxID=85831 RepID=UPI003F68EFEC
MGSPRLKVLTRTRSLNTLTLFLEHKEDTFIVLDNASVHRTRNKGIERTVGETRTFSLLPPPYSPHLNLAETLWRIMKTKWNQTAGLCSSDNLFYTVNRALAAVGDTLGIKLKHNAA